MSVRVIGFVDKKNTVSTFSGGCLLDIKTDSDYSAIAVANSGGELSYLLISSSGVRLDPTMDSRLGMLETESGDFLVGVPRPAGGGLFDVTTLTGAVVARRVAVSSLRPISFGVYSPGPSVPKLHLP